MASLATENDTNPSAIDVSIVMPCLNEAQSLPHCIANAREALAEMHDRMGFFGEIIISDNGSDDGSQGIARSLGVGVVHCATRGYGAALIHGMRSAKGRYLVMGDADGSYDFRDAVAMVEKLVDGADLCLGSRFKAGIARGAMPWKNRYIGNPLLTGVLNIFFGAGVSDAHCGLRALTRKCFERLDLNGSGMEFASEMIIKAALKKQRIAETPAKLAPDLRGRPPHLRPWRDGWRHLRYLFMLSPLWAFLVPAGVAATASLSIWAVAAWAALAGDWRASQFGNYWVVLAGALFGLSHIAVLMAMVTHIHGRNQGYRLASRWEWHFKRWLSLETMLVAGGLIVAAGLAILLSVVGYWSTKNFGAINSVLPAVIGTTLITIGAQNALGGFLLAIVNGHEVEFLKFEPIQVGPKPTAVTASASEAAADAAKSQREIARAASH